jgi:Flp pilus assembly protein TadG
MEMQMKIPRLLGQRKGVTAVMVAIMIVMLLGFAALAIDLGYGMVTRNELQNAADAAALAGARELGLMYENGSAISLAPIIDVARDTVEQNLGSAFILNDSDVELGEWVSGSLDTTSSDPDAVRVTVSMDAMTNGPITTFFAGVIGVNSMAVSATATAWLSAPILMPEGEVIFPGAISSIRFNSPFCDANIVFSGNPKDNCAGWHTFTDNFYNPADPNSNKLRCIINTFNNDCASSDNLVNCANGLDSAGCLTTPEIRVGETQFEFTNGGVASAFSNLLELFDEMKGKNDGFVDKDNDPETWTTVIPVYDEPGTVCSAPNGARTIVGFATVTITGVRTSPDKEVDVTILCDQALAVPGGLPPGTGTIASIPGLVQ